MQILLLLCEMDHKVEIKEEPIWLDGTANTSFENYELVPEKTHWKEEIKSEVVEPRQTQPVADVKDEIFIEEHPVDQLVPHFEVNDNVENLAVLTRSLEDSRCKVVKTGSQPCHLLPDIEQSVCIKVKNELLSESEDRPFHHEEHSTTFTIESNHDREKVTPSAEWCNHCNVCGKEFIWKSSLRQHLLTHTQKRSFRCDLCGSWFSQKSNLKTHIRLHTGERPFPCTECSMSFSQKGTLKSHLLIHSGERPFRCDTCNKMFAQKSYLRTHMLTHTRERPHSCHQCDRKFTDRSVLRKHLLVHSGVRRHRCAVCCRRFALKAALQSHMVTHNRERPSRRRKATPL